VIRSILIKWKSCTYLLSDQSFALEVIRCRVSEKTGVDSGVWKTSIRDGDQSSSQPSGLLNHLNLPFGFALVLKLGPSKRYPSPTGSTENRILTLPMTREPTVHPSQQCPLDLKELVNISQPPHPRFPCSHSYSMHTPCAGSSKIAYWPSGLLELFVSDIGSNGQSQPPEYYRRKELYRISRRVAYKWVTSHIVSSHSIPIVDVSLRPLSTCYASHTLARTKLERP